MFFLLFFGPLTKKFAHHWVRPLDQSHSLEFPQSIEDKDQEIYLKTDLSIVSFRSF